MVAHQSVAPTGTSCADRPCSFHRLADTDRSIGIRYSSWRLSTPDSPVASWLADAWSRKPCERVGALERFHAKAGRLVQVFLKHLPMLEMTDGDRTNCRFYPMPAISITPPAAHHQGATPARHARRDSHRVSPSPALCRVHGRVPATGQRPHRLRCGQDCLWAHRPAGKQVA